HSLSLGVSNIISIPPFVIGTVLTILTGIIFWGGLKRIVAVIEKMVPIMTGIYVLACLIIIFFNLESFYSALKSIFSNIFSFQSALGGALGVGVQKAIRYGVARNIFSNGAGLGYASHAHAIADSRHPAQQGVLAIFVIFVDTFVMSCTAFVILISGRVGEGFTGISLTQIAFFESLGNVGSIFVTICLFFFALTTILSWYLFGEINLKSQFKDKGIKRYRILVMISIFIGSLTTTSFIWEISDFFIAFMLIPNMIALISMSDAVKESSLDYDNLNLSEIFPQKIFIGEEE
ncbi:MAG: alanine/glycine:cation symporter family protein, partial [Fusobacteriaceae bacterium]